MAGVIILGHARPNKEFNSQSSKFIPDVLRLVYFLLDIPYKLSAITGSRLKSDCVGNLMRLSLDKALAVGNQLEVEAISE